MLASELAANTVTSPRGVPAGHPPATVVHGVLGIVLGDTGRGLVDGGADDVLVGALRSVDEAIGSVTGCGPPDEHAPRKTATITTATNRFTHTE